MRDILIGAALGLMVYMVLLMAAIISNFPATLLTAIGVCGIDSLYGG